MPLLNVALGERSYPIIISPGALDQLPEYLLPLSLSPSLLLVTNPLVFQLYGKKVLTILQKAGYLVTLGLIADSEEAKSLETAKELYDLALEGQIDRSSGVLALGGGVVGDTAGFVAATYMRGISFIPLPTTLLAQVDSSVGGKVAVNHPAGKNLIGAFYQPRLVVTDPTVLASLPEEEIRTGLAEVIKYGVIRDANFFGYLEENLSRLLAREPEALTEVITRSCAIKAEVVSQDEKEENQRAILNFGHTLGHALETLTGYQTLRHGEAVAVGMVFEAELAVRKGFFTPEAAARIRKILEKAGLPTSFPGLKAEEILPLLYHDKKTRARALTFILPLEIGKVEIYPGVKPEEVAALISQG